jgi:hypothetical protein
LALSSDGDTGAEKAFSVAPPGKPVLGCDSASPDDEDGDSVD